MPNATQATARKELDLLVRTGLGVEQLAPALASVLGKLMGAVGCFIGWSDEHGVPVGFYHDSAPAGTQELFLNNYYKLFVGPNEYTMIWLLGARSRAVGNMLFPDRAFFKSNTYNLLFKPCDHHFALDLRVEVNGITRMAIALFRGNTFPFSEDDAKRLHALTPAMQMALVKAPHAAGASSYVAAPSSAGTTGVGHLLVSPDGARIQMINDPAVQLLRLAKLFGQGIWLVGQMTESPQFIYQLCLKLKSGSAGVARSSLAVEGGLLLLSAVWLKPTWQVMQAVTPADLSVSAPSMIERILVTVEFQKPAALDVVRSITQLDLSPLQSRIAMFAAAGGSRIDCADHHGVSKEALKKHLREIYAASRCADWQELTVRLNAS